ncbi:hypothetical protein ACFVKB_48945 [Rhodococcus sp. NPDC127530]|uniref:hypothetical protein n=1 Tax=unclassified Rhodococcus (in: high G+C Gram-positive bacteria) TaxID=192944 RepID=UPI003643BC79
MTIEQLGQDLDAIIRAVGGNAPIALVGHSMGGRSILGFLPAFTHLDETAGVKAYRERPVNLGAFDESTRQAHPTTPPWDGVRRRAGRRGAWAVRG